MRATISGSLLLMILGCDRENNNAKPLDPRLAEVLDTHNEVRASALPAPSPALPGLIWADDLAEASQAYAELCNFAHDDNLGFLGENLAVNAPAGFLDGRAVVLNWASEASDYNYDTNSCNGVCGHYTQIVWRDTTEVGCGVATCNGIQGFTDGEGELWVCRYRDPGNFVGQKPY